MSAPFRSPTMRLLSLLLLLFSLAGLRPVAADEPIPADPPARWWKGNLHTHTLWSDGDDFPEMIAEWYRDRDYHFLTLSDHNRLSEGQRWMKIADIDKRGGTNVFEKYVKRYGDSWVETRGAAGRPKSEVRLKPLEEFRTLVEDRGRFLMIQGEEITDKSEGVPVHMNATNLKDQIEPLGGATVRETIENNLRNVEDQAKRLGREILIHLNHPNFHYGVTAEDLAHAVTEQYFEIFNGHPGVNIPGDEQHPSVDRIWDIANTIRLAHLKAPALYGLGTDDSHNYHAKTNPSAPGRGWQMVRATHLTPEKIIRAIRAGDSYASSGVTLRDVRYDAGQKLLEIEVEPNGDAVFTIEFIGTPKTVDPEGKVVLDKDGQPLKDKAGKPLRVSKTYSEQIGQVLATSTGLKARYELTGKELYVRARVTSSLPPANPSYKNQRAQAWTQPVGW
jgi:hypothetical protein